jgi:hypothetical protein
MGYFGTESLFEYANSRTYPGFPRWAAAPPMAHDKIARLTGFEKERIALSGVKTA